MEGVQYRRRNQVGHRWPPSSFLCWLFFEISKRSGFRWMYSWHCFLFLSKGRYVSGVWYPIIYQKGRGAEAKKDVGSFFNGLRWRKGMLQISLILIQGMLTKHLLSTLNCSCCIVGWKWMGIECIYYWRHCVVYKYEWKRVPALERFNQWWEEDKMSVQIAHRRWQV